MEATNPATGEQLAVYDEDDDDAVEEKLTTAHSTFEEWRGVPLRKREQLLVNVGEVLRENKRRYAELMTKEMGKPISQAIAEVEKCAWACDHYAEYAHKYLSPEHHPSPPGSEVKTVYDPLGPVLAVMPWNFPFWQVMRFAAPYVTAGNVGLLKHASNVPGCALAIEEVFQEAGYPEGVFQTLLVGSNKVDDVLKDDRVRAVTLTGSGPPRPPANILIRRFSNSAAVTRLLSLRTRSLRLPLTRACRHATRMAANPASRLSGLLFTKPSTMNS